MAVGCFASSSSCGIHAQIEDSKKALHRPLRNRNVLDVGEIDCHFADRHDAFADAQTAVGSDVPALFEVQAHDRKMKKSGQEVQKEDNADNEKKPKEPACFA